jgi:hypothetical protein
VLQDRSLPPVDRFAAGRATVLALLLLVAIPAAAQARNIQIDGRVTGPPRASGGAVTVPLQLTKRAGNALKLGTRRVTVRLGRRARLRMTGAGASGASRLTPSGLRAGDRLKGVTSLSRSARLRMRWHAVPSLKLKRARVIRPAPRTLATPGGIRPLPPFSGVPGIQGSAGPGSNLGPIVASLQAQTSRLAPRADELGPLAQTIEARSVQRDDVETGLEEVKVAFDGLKSALEALSGQGVPPAELDPVVDQVEALQLRVEALKNGIGSGPLKSALGDLEGVLGKVRSAVQKLVPSVATLPAQIGLIQQTPEAPAQVGELEAAARRLNGLLDSAESALGSFESGMGGLTAGMTSLADSIDELAIAAGSAANFPSVSAGVTELGPVVAGLESGFASIQATGASLVTTADGIETDAVLLESTVGELCSLVSETCP